MGFTEWHIDIDENGDSVPSTERSQEFTGWIEGVRITSADNANAVNLTGALLEVGGMEDDVWGSVSSPIAIGQDAELIKYPVHEETNPDNSDPGTSRLFYMSQQSLRMVLASGSGELASAVTVRVKYIV